MILHCSYLQNLDFEIRHQYFRHGKFSIVLLPWKHRYKVDETNVSWPKAFPIFMTLC